MFKLHMLNYVLYKLGYYNISPSKLQDPSLERFSFDLVFSMLINDPKLHLYPHMTINYIYDRDNFLKDGKFNKFCSKKINDLYRIIYKMLADMTKNKPVNLDILHFCRIRGIFRNIANTHDFCIVTNPSLDPNISGINVKINPDFIRYIKPSYNPSVPIKSKIRLGIFLIPLILSPFIPYMPLVYFVLGLVRLCMMYDMIKDYCKKAYNYVRGGDTKSPFNPEVECKIKAIIYPEIPSVNIENLNLKQNNMIELLACYKQAKNPQIPAINNLVSNQLTEVPVR